MKVVVTGHTGFIGSNLTAYLAHLGYETVVCSRRTGCDLLDPKQASHVVRKGELVYHLAADAKPAESLLSPVEAFNVNTSLTMNVALACRDSAIPLVYVSSCEIYGDYAAPITEDTRFAPTNPYAASKAAADRLLYSFNRAYGLDVKIVRLFNPFGPRQQLNKVLPTFYRQAVSGKPITVFGDGNDTRDYVYIEDVTRGLWEARRLPAGEVVNIATGVATTTRQVAEMIIAKIGSPSRIEITPYPKLFGGIRHQVGSNEKARRMLGWEPLISFSVGVDETVKWLEALDSSQN